jgi:DNA-binding transcriptional LysR family regulator
MAIVPSVTVRHELKSGVLVRLSLPELTMPRRTVMIYRDQGYISDAAREFIRIVRASNWTT